jgi:eukaryotic-like serine/threonine-protein kinase
MSSRDLTEIGKYRIIDLVGEGAMGVVYKALDPVLNRNVAIKVMGDAIARDDELRDRFLREARAAGSLQHPNVITIYDFGDVEGHPFIAMEYVEGIDLEDLLRSGTPLSLEAKLGIMIDVLNGLAYAHKRGVVHRDIKPANIRVDEEGHARIMDFGIAHLNSSAMTKMTRTGIMLGTPNYMAPEQIIGQDITPKTDIFAAGAVLYEILTNARPFQADTLHAVLYKITSEKPTPVDKLLPGLPASLNDIVSRSLEKEPNDRFASAAEMAAELGRVRASLSQAPQSALSLHATIERMRSTGEQLRIKEEEQERRRRAMYIGGGLVAVAAVVAVAGAMLFARSASQSQTPGGVASEPSTVAPGSPNVATHGTTTGATTTAAGAVTSSAPTHQPVSVVAPTTKDSAAGARTAGLQELERARNAQIAALRARRGARDAGATVAQLQEGDAHEQRGEDALNRKRYAEANGHFASASASFDAAERLARVAATAASNSASVSAVTRDPPKPTAPSSFTAPAPTQSAPVAQPVPAVQPQSTSRPPANPAEEINAVISEYARAIESRDIAELKRTYPGITREQQQRFSQFFSSIRSLQAVLSVTSLDVDGSSAEAKLAGTYEYVTSAGRTERQAVAFVAQLRRESAGWKLASIR